MLLPKLRQRGKDRQEPLCRVDVVPALHCRPLDERAEAFHVVFERRNQFLPALTVGGVLLIGREAEGEENGGDNDSSAVGTLLTSSPRLRRE